MVVARLVAARGDETCALSSPPSRPARGSPRRTHTPTLRRGRRTRAPPRAPPARPAPARPSRRAPPHHPSRPALPSPRAPPRAPVPARPPPGRHPRAPSPRAPPRAPPARPAPARPSPRALPQARRTRPHSLARPALPRARAGRSQLTPRPLAPRSFPGSQGTHSEVGTPCALALLSTRLRPAALGRKAARGPGVQPVQGLGESVAPQAPGPLPHPCRLAGRTACLPPRQPSPSSQPRPLLPLGCARGTPVLAAAKISHQQTARESGEPETGMDEVKGPREGEEETGRLEAARAGLRGYGEKPEKRERGAGGGGGGQSLAERPEAGPAVGTPEGRQED
ncbi:unnamed protein product [Nyctereutes procyonoides]|uniref:(raccoon dog) hypothetical protein n=1 Tax=Nyctereutes procyonoides TaxID=34880 RepID=A0A811ZMI9_NYCPR|nr:unnamed protein product [Nyctereutes procyonoides]